MDNNQVGRGAITEVNAADLASLALCAWREARGDGPDGMRAVMHVIVNRAARWFNGRAGSIHETIYAKGQFSSMSVPTDPEFRLFPAGNDVQHQFCQAMCEAVIDGSDPDISNKALYYANLSESHSDWFKKNIVDSKEHPATAKIGRQTFFA